MRPNLTFALIILTYFFCTCSSREIIITNQAAYYSEDDSVSVMEDFEKIKSSFGSSQIFVAEDSANYTPPILIKQEIPDYPEYKIGVSNYIIEGSVMVQILISKEGKVERAYILKSSEKTFNKACLEAAMQWEFKPATKKGEPAADFVAIPFKFRFGNKEK